MNGDIHSSVIRPFTDFLSLYRTVKVNSEAMVPGASNKLGE